jgi:hypothetical protein
MNSVVLTGAPAKYRNVHTTIEAVIQPRSMLGRCRTRDVARPAASGIALELGIAPAIPRAFAAFGQNFHAAGRNLRAPFRVEAVHRSNAKGYFVHQTMRDLCAVSSEHIGLHVEIENHAIITRVIPEVDLGGVRYRSPCGAAFLLVRVCDWIDAQFEGFDGAIGAEHRKRCLAPVVLVIKGVARTKLYPDVLALPDGGLGGFIALELCLDFDTVSEDA